VSAETIRRALAAVDPVLRTGRVRKIMPTHIEADGPNVQLGALCLVEAKSPQGRSSFHSEVVRVDRDRVVLSPLEEADPTFSGATVTACADTNRVGVGPSLLGRAVDSLSRPLDSRGPVHAAKMAPLHGSNIIPLLRDSPAQILATGIRAIDALLTLGKGQRIGIFAASGVGKTSLMTQIARQVDADITILCLVGERGREVEAIWNHGMDDDARSRATLVAATSDQSAAMRVRAAHYALAMADYWRSQGKHVVLLLDSVTRLAMALREIGLAAGEPPTVRAYTPSVFVTIPKMIERCGALKSGGAITAIVTVLSETNDVDDPISELMKSLLDGHIILSRSLAEQAHFPAIDVLRSVSRHAEGVVTASQRQQAVQVLEWLSLQEASRTLVDTGLYVKGANARTDRALERYPAITAFLKQGRNERADAADTHASLSLLAQGAV
jgi:flagellum-specific ATP synthase